MTQTMIDSITIAGWFYIGTICAAWVAVTWIKKR